MGCVASLPWQCGTPNAWALPYSTENLLSLVLPAHISIGTMLPRKSTSLQTVPSCCRTQMISRQGAVAFRHWSLPDIITYEAPDALSGCQRGKSLAGVNLSGRRNRFDPCRAAHVRAAVAAFARDRIIKFVNGSCV